MNINKKIFFAVSFFTLGIFGTISANAICPICTVAVAGGVGLARWLGVDDTVTGIWIGGLMVSLIMWTINWFEKKNIRFWQRGLITTLLYHGLVVVPLIWIDVIGHPLNKIWGMDKLLFGIIAGSLVFLGAVYLYEFLKRKNNNSAHFPFEKVAFPVAALIIASGIMYFVTLK